jgi:hypothetical protein
VFHLRSLFLKTCFEQSISFFLHFQVFIFRRLTEDPLSSPNTLLVLWPIMAISVYVNIVHIINDIPI